MTASARRRLVSLVPDQLGVLAEYILGDVIGVVIAVRSREDDDGNLHDVTSMR